MPVLKVYKMVLPQHMNTVQLDFMACNGSKQLNSTYSPANHEGRAPISIQQESSGQEVTGQLQSPPPLFSSCQDKNLVTFSFVDFVLLVTCSLSYFFRKQGPTVHNYANNDREFICIIKLRFENTSIDHTSVTVSNVYSYIHFKWFLITAYQKC